MVVRKVFKQEFSKGSGCHSTLIDRIIRKIFNDVSWVQKNNIGFKDPYEIISEIDRESINQGGMAATTFAKLLFSDLSETERSKLRDALLRYCELDTLAMVMIAESWLNTINLTNSLTS